MEFSPTIGLEVHAELKTQTKMFCRSKNDPDEKRPNVNVCPVCLAHPGTLPVINKKAVEHVLRLGHAVGGTTPDFTEFDRKNYFYPDIPKGYQISQYKYPLVAGGELNGVQLTRVHLEEDTARSIHDIDPDYSLVDFNRAGVPLMELVTEPVIISSRQAADFARELQLLLRYLDISEANMEKGEMRVEANVSLSMGTKVEVKNLNSFRAVEKAIEYELARQQEVLEKGEKVVQETRGWDEARGVTFSQRQKESSHDYRYFPDPDLPKIYLSGVEEFRNLKDTLPELPWQKRDRLTALGFLQKQDVEQLISDFALGCFFDEVSAELKDSNSVKIAANLTLNYIAGERMKSPTWLPEVRFFADIVRRNQAGEFSMPQVKSSILSGVAAEVASADSLGQIINDLIAQNPKVVADYKAGKAAALQFLVGQGMKLSRGSANPEILQAELLKKLG